MPDQSRSVTGRWSGKFSFGLLVHATSYSASGACTHLGGAGCSTLEPQVDDTYLDLVYETRQSSCLCLGDTLPSVLAGTTLHRLRSGSSLGACVLLTVTLKNIDYKNEHL
jgi:hypothetical protein